VNGELARRKAANDKAGQIIVLAVDEAASDELLQNPANLLALQNISQQARKYRLHLILATQKPGHSSLPKILDNLLNRWVGQLSDAGLSARVTGQAGLGAHKLTGNGDFLHLAGPVVERLQIAQATRPDFDRLERSDRVACSCTSRLPPLQPVGTFRPRSVQLAVPDIVELPASATGRPPAQVEPVILAHYWHYGPDNISRQQAEAMFNLKRTGHVLHRDFCREFGLAWLKLRRNEGK
jgi:DNA segregation ATPase FtsK/SpoIIIE-like protein